MSHHLARISRFIFALALVASTASSRAQSLQQSSTPNAPDSPASPTGSVEILTDTQGVDFGPYLTNLLPRIRENWYKLIPSDAKTKKGRLAIKFAIQKNGQISGMQLVASSGDISL